MSKKIINIENRAFDNCCCLKIVEMPELIERIGNFVFNKCIKLKISLL